MVKCVQPIWKFKKMHAKRKVEKKTHTKIQTNFHNWFHFMLAFMIHELWVVSIFIMMTDTKN